jgi:DNA-binding protein HU-beta
MTKTQLIDKIAKDGGFKKSDAEKFTEVFLNTIMDEVANGEKIQITGFGSFERKERPARTIRNPKTGEPMDVAASKTPSFSAGSIFKEKVKGK